MGTNDLGFACQHAVDHAVFFGFFRGHPVVSIAVCPNLVEIGSGCARNDGVEFLFELHDFACGDLDVRGLTLCTAEG